jgi:uncharacterized protein YecT (DUF1311 family)
MICRDGDITNEDAQLGQAFQQKRNALSQAARDALIREERDWIASRDRECGVPTSGPWTDADLIRLKPCLIQKTRARQSQLVN